MIALDFGRLLPEFETSRTCRITAVLLLLWWLAYTYPAVTVPGGSVARSLVDSAESTERGSLYNQLVLFAFCGLGLYYFRHALAVLKSRQGQLLAFLLTLYCAWSTTSLLWSEDPRLTVRRLVAFFCLVIGSFGLGAGYYGRRTNGLMVFARHVSIAAFIGIALLVGFHFDILQDYLDPRTSFKDSARVASIAYPAAFAVLASLFPLHASKRWRLAAAGFLLAILVVLKVRTIVFDALAAALLLYSRITPVRITRILLLLVASALIVVLLDLNTGGKLLLQIFALLRETVYDWMSYLTMGQHEDNITSLSGRMPLWKAIYPYIEAQPLQGYGFGAFWNSTRFDEIYAVAKWRAPAAHNGYLDELLATGIVGLTAFLSFWFTAMALCVRNARKSGSDLQGYLVFCWLLSFLLFNGTDSIMQNFSHSPTFGCLIGVFAFLTPRPELELHEIQTMLVQGFMIEEVVT